MNKISKNAREPETSEARDSLRKGKRTRHLGTFADGQRAEEVTVTYSAEVGSFGETDRG